jgi:hypothetical protein
MPLCYWPNGLGNVLKLLPEGIVHTASETLHKSGPVKMPRGSLFARTLLIFEFKLNIQVIPPGLFTKLCILASI